MRRFTGITISQRKRGIVWKVDAPLRQFGAGIISRAGKRKTTNGQQRQPRRLFSQLWRLWRQWKPCGAASSSAA
jgi:hypothetical protein